MTLATLGAGTEGSCRHNLTEDSFRKAFLYLLSIKTYATKAHEAIAAEKRFEKDLSMYRTQCNFIIYDHYKSMDVLLQIECICNTDGRI